MKRSVRNIFGLVFAVAGSVLVAGVAPGCADNESSLFIRQIQVPQASAGGGCKVDSSPTSTARMTGVLDVAIGSQYEAALLVGNQLVDRGSRNDLKTETSRIRLEGSEVYVTDSSGRQIAGPYTVPGTGFIDPASGANASYGVLHSVLVDSVAVAKLKSELSAQPRGTVRRVTAHVRVFGRTLGGQEVDSGEWAFPLEVCYGCLVSYPPEANNQTLQPQPNCMNPATDQSSLPEPCNLGQDEPVDCRVCHKYASSSGVCEPPTQ